MKETYKIKDLEQIKLLSDPLKLQLLQAFALAERTTKQVAEELGESVTKLYRHVDALHDAGLLEIIQETRKRGTVERTFRAVAQRFEADHELFAEDAEQEGINVARDLLRAGEAEILEAIASMGKGEGDALEPLFVRFRCTGTAERIEELRDSLANWIESVQAEDECKEGGTDEAGAMIAFYPIRQSKHEQKSGD